MAREPEGTGEDGVPGEDGDDVLILGGGGGGGGGAVKWIGALTLAMGKEVVSERGGGT